MRYFNNYEVNIGNLIYNVNKIKRKIGENVKFCAIVKCDAYRHNLISVVNGIKDIVDYFAVANFYEALKIRVVDKKTPILVLGVVDVNNINECVKNNISISIINLEYLKCVTQKNRNIKFHIMINTGLNRFGINNVFDFKKALKYISQNKLNLLGIFTHFATKEKDTSYINYQFEYFNKFTNLVDEKCICHCCNSFAALNYKEKRMNMVRCGFAMYGYMNNTEMKPCLEIKSQIVHILKCKKGESIGYDRTFVCPYNMEIAVIPLGYGDGLDRRLSNQFNLIVKDEWCKIVGNICMDVCMIDVTNKNSLIGDEVIILGKSDGKEITLHNYANVLQTSPYEILLKFNYQRMNLVIKK